MTLSGLLLPIIFRKYNISCILFTKDFKVVEFTDNVKDFANDLNALCVNADIRESFWGLVGIEARLLDLDNEIKDYLHIPMLSKDDSYYDINIEICNTEKNQKFYIAMFTRQSKLSLNYLHVIQQINHENLLNANQKENIKNNQIYYNLINQKLISFHIDNKGKITEVNNACTLFFGLEKREMLGFHFSKFFFSREVKISSTEVSSILKATNKEDIEVFFHTDIIPISSEQDVSNNIIICQDITYLKKIESELEYAVNHDSLTGLPNRLMLRKKIEDAIKRSKETNEIFALCFIDLNKFKIVNDEYGHHVGDMLLKHVGDVLTKIIREKDTIARIGGDEFVILFEHLESMEYLDLALQRIEYISKNNPLYYNENLTLELSFSLGIGIYPKDGEDIETLLNSADEKMYEYKKQRAKK